MNCLSESGTCQAIAQQNPFVKRSRKQHCTFKQISRNGLERVTKRPPASVPHHQHQQRNNRKASRSLVACQASQLSGPGAWGEAGDKNVVLVADIGGTNCRFVLWRLDLQKENHERLFSKVYPTKDYITFEHALDALASESAFKKDTPGAAAFACAGPVLDNKCVMTNLEWVIDGASLTMKYGIRMAVLNDFEACGYGVPALQPEDLLMLNDVPARQKVCCGSGLQRIYEFLQTDEHCARPDLDLTMQKTAADISKTAIDNSDQLAVEAVDLFLALIGAEAGHMGLRSLASGGIYICGGIMPKLLERIKLGGVLDSYLHEKSRFNKLLKTFPLYVVLNEGLGLLGTREYAIRLVQTPNVCK